MFNINPRTNHIKLTRGNSCKIDILPLVVSGNDKTSKEPIILQDGDRVIFTIAGVSGRKYLQKILTPDDYDENDDSLNLILFPEDTINLKPLNYIYDVILVYDNGTSITFIDNAMFSILPAVGTYQDLERRDK